MAVTPLSDAALDQLFRSARSIHTFTDEPVTEEVLRRVYELSKWGPTAFNAQPARFVFVRTAQGKARLEPTLSGSNREKTRLAPVTVIIAHDTRFFERLPQQQPGANVERFTTDASLAEATAVRNSTLQGAYFLLAARSLGLSVGPMSGFDPAAVNREFFPDGRCRANFLANLGYPRPDAPRPRGPRLAFDDVVAWA